MLAKNVRLSYSIFERYLLMINEEEEKPPPKNLFYSDLGPLSVGDLESYIHKLESDGYGKLL